MTIRTSLAIVWIAPLSAACVLVQDLGSTGRDPIVDEAGLVDAGAEIADARPATAEDAKEAGDIEGPVDTTNDTTNDTQADVDDASVETATTDAPLDAKADASVDASVDDPFDPATCAATPLGAFGLPRSLEIPRIYEIAVRVRSCDDDLRCGAWRIVPESEPVPNGFAVGQTALPLVRRGTLVATSAYTFSMASVETCAGRPSAKYGAENCEAKANGQIGCSYYMNAAGPHGRSPCDERVAIPGLVGTVGPGCLRGGWSFLDRSTRTQWELAFFVRH
jgi:hypothetical protein